jgi:hypothetical protein
MPNEGREEQPYATREEAEAALQRGREVWADSASIARIQWNEARVHPYTGPRKLPTCPKCGEPPRFKVTARVVKVECYRRGYQMVEGKAKHYDKQIPGHPVRYECGGGHRWEEEA